MKRDITDVQCNALDRICRLAVLPAESKNGVNRQYSAGTPTFKKPM